jgi:beta-barrel assembly-enhancing protease
MEFEAKQIPEGINTTKEHPLKEFFILLAGVGVLIAIAFFILIFLSDYLVQFIPLEKEQQWFSSSTISSFSEQEVSPDEKSVNEYLSRLVNQLASPSTIPGDYKYSIQLIEEESPNAFITPGGHIFITSGLLNMVNSENALAMVIAHEMAHQIHRHPIRSLGRGMIIGMVAMIFTGVDGSEWASQILTNSFHLGLLAYSRDQEREADKTGLKLLVDYYGHSAGSDYFFSQMMQHTEYKQSKLTEYLSTHPDTGERLKYLQQHAVNEEAELTPLPDFIKKYVSQDHANTQKLPEPST